MQERLVGLLESGVPTALGLHPLKHSDGPGSRLAQSLRLLEGEAHHITPGRKTLNRWSIGTRSSSIVHFSVTSPFEARGSSGLAVVARPDIIQPKVVFWAMGSPSCPLRTPSSKIME
ncbi:uncharacterized protein LOC143374894 [Andrena cerasifolii]|uniref:uncharacterized protein LOC143374894 n=1 Tax=Andrena cerasifolii TaxID=2819439 RepID=UPI004038395B